MPWRFALMIGLLLNVALPAQAADDHASLARQIQAANISGSGTIALRGDITLSGELPAITSNLVIEGNGHSISGGGEHRIFAVSGGNLTLRDIRLSDGRAHYGGAIRLRNGAGLRLENATLLGNIAEKSAGAIYASGGTLHISDSRFEKNCSLFATFTVVSPGSDRDERSVDSDGCPQVDYYRSEIDAELQAQVGGGAIRLLHGARASIKRSDFNENKAAYGGAIDTEGSQLTVSGSSFYGNRASEIGGGISASWAVGTMSISGSSFVKNRSERGGGGAIDARNHKVDIANSTFSENYSSFDGGAIQVDKSSEIAIAHTTFVQNRARNDADAIENAGGKAYLRNSIIANSGPADDCSGAWQEKVGNLSLDGSCAETASGALLLGELTGSPAHYPLRDRSPAIDRADPRYCLERDQLGTARPQGGGCDIGAIEGRGLMAAEATPVPPVVCSLAYQIIAANRDRPAGGCPAGNGADTITIEKDITLYEALPAITSHIIIEGNGHSISGNREFRVFDVDGGNLTVKNLSIIDASAPEAIGGAIRLRNHGHASVSHSSFIGNRAETGGAIGVDSFGASSRLTVQESRFTGNRAIRWGGAVSLIGGSAVVTKSSFTQNTAGASGGAINLYNHARLEVTNSSFLDSGGAGWGGNALAAENGSSATLTHVTMYNRNPTGTGTELYTRNSSRFGAPNNVRLRNSIIAEAGPGYVVLCYGSLTQNIGNIIEGGACSPMLALDPLLEEPSDDSTFIAPLPGSPAIKTADPRFCPATDQLGNPRAQAGRCDIGAIETLAVTRAIGECHVRTTHKLNFRESPGGERIGTVPEHATMPASARTHAWFQVDYRGKSGWISADYVRTDGDCA